MYDSEEVRGAVRRDALAVFMHRTGAFQGFADLPPLDLLVINEALTAEGNPWQRALLEYVEEQANRPRAIAGTPDPRPWYEKNRDKIQLHTSSREALEALMEAL